MRITRKNLDETVRINREIRKEIDQHIAYIWKFVAKYGALSPEKQAIHILKENHLIQLPIPDADWGGALKRLPNGVMIPVINTAQPRMYQYFIGWHEIYHLTESGSAGAHFSHEISTELQLTERKADYFASRMMMNDKVYEYFYRSETGPFIHRIARCMDAFKVPYKGVLIELYESAIQFEDEELQTEITEHFDITFDWHRIFQELSLDVALVEPTFIVDISELKSLAHQKSEGSPDDRAYQETRGLIDEIERKFLMVKGNLENGGH